MGTKTIKILAIPLAMAFILAGCGEPSDVRPAEPKPIRTMYIDPESRSCTKYKNRRCIKWKTDDQDWVIVTADGKQYDVEEDEYNSVDANGTWPK